MPSVRFIIIISSSSSWMWMAEVKNRLRIIITYVKAFEHIYRDCFSYGKMKKMQFKLFVNVRKHILCALLHLVCHSISSSAFVILRMCERYLFSHFFCRKHLNCVQIITIARGFVETKTTTTATATSIHVKYEIFLGHSRTFSVVTPWSS